MPLPRREDGQTIVEYAMVLGVLTLVLFSFVTLTGLDDVFTGLVQAIQTALS
jgi:Flp pilus assembly pilin Flp